MNTFFGRYCRVFINNRNTIAGQAIVNGSALMRYIYCTRVHRAYVAESNQLLLSFCIHCGRSKTSYRLGYARVRYTLEKRRREKITKKAYVGNDFLADAIVVATVKDIINCDFFLYFLFL